MPVDIFEIGIERLKNEQAENEANNGKALGKRSITICLADSTQQNSEFKRILDILVCGSSKSVGAILVLFQLQIKGKSTFINRFLERTQNPDPTVGLCYKFATRTRVNVIKYLSIV